ncbi:MAG TPA: molybdenum cofactor guanylyltransferase [Candidatus Acidoferrales bacterium]|nr:molybdenum cofactor guanylyltransferase [Candidatus Acidoferrales bacterium]
MLGPQQNPQSDRQTQVEAFILAGGVSSRMGRDKHSLELAGVPIILRTLRLVLPLTKKVTIVGAVSLSLPLEVIAVADDDYDLPTETGKSKSPLFGIATALSHSESPWILILACDLPYLTGDWLAWLIARAEKSGAQIVMPYTAQNPQPLAAMYRRECGPAIVRSLRSGVRRVKDALAQFTIEALPESEWRQFDPEGIVLKSMNTPSDYDEACKWWLAKEPPKLELPGPRLAESLWEKRS